MTDRTELKRMVEALLFAAEKPLSLEDMAARLPAEADVATLISDLQADYESRGVHVVAVGDKWMMRTAGDLSFLLRREVEDTRKLSRAGVETPATIAYHQPVTRTELEDIRGVSVSKGTIDVLMEAGWVRPMGRRRTPGKPVTYGTTEEFLIHFGLASLDDLPGLEELKAAGLLDSVDVALAKMARRDADAQKHDLERDDDQLDLEDAIDETYADSAFEEDFADQGETPPSSGQGN